MNIKEVMQFLEAHGSEQTKKVLIRHGAKEPFYGVKIGDLKILQKKIKKDHELALKLYQTGNGDAMYLAALIADPSKFTSDVLNEWVEQATWYMVSDYAVAWMAAESHFGLSLAHEWIRSNKEYIASAGWFAYASVLAIKPNHELDQEEIRSLLQFITDNINDAPNRVRYAMNNFVIAAGLFVPVLTEECKVYGDMIGNVEVDMGETSCKVPNAREYIEKVEARGTIGKKRKRAVC